MHPARVLIYSHDTYGLGHIRRSLSIASALAALPERPSVLIATGSPRAQAYEMPAGCDTLTLPAVVKNHDGTYSARKLEMPLEEIIGLRTRLLLSALKTFRPDVILVDHAPLGVEGELLPVLQSARSLARPPRLVLGLRDIIDDAERVRAEWRAKGIWRRLRYYDDVLVYGDRRLPTTAAELELEARLPGRVHHVGYLVPTREDDVPAESAERPRFLVMAGGGGDGHGLLRGWAAYLESLEDRAAFETDVLTGPFLSPRRREEIRQRFDAIDQPVHIHDFVADAAPLMRRAAGVVSMAGYNSVIEVLALERPCLLVPREHPRLEQTVRAERLARRGMFDWTPLADATPARFDAFVRRALEGATRPRGDLEVDGLSRTAHHLSRNLNGRNGSAAGSTRASTGWTL